MADASREHGEMVPPTVNLSTLGPRQIDLLRRIVATNGGGLMCLYGEEGRIVRSLEKRGLVQGKLGSAHRAVHTAEGLELIRRLDHANQ